MNIFNTTTDSTELLPLEVLANSVDLRLFLSIIQMLKVIEDPNIPTAQVELLDNRKLVMKINRKFMEQLTIPQKLYVIIHECSHVLFHHFSRLDKANQKLANIATDAVINSLIESSYVEVERPLSDIVSISQLEKMRFISQEEIESLGKSRDDLTSEDVYHLLENKVNNVLKVLKSFDDHEKLPQNLPDDYEVIIEQVIKQIENNVYGDKTANFIKRLKASLKKYFPFKQVLTTILEKKKLDYSRPNRRMKIKNIFIPRYKFDKKAKIYAMVDVSGSTWDYIDDFVAYIRSLPNFEELMFIDTTIKTVSKGGEIPKIIKGGGGTDLNPGFRRWAEIEEKNKTKKLNFICLTDGEVPPLTVGPVKSKVIILTTGKPINFPQALSSYINIKIQI